MRHVGALNPPRRCLQVIVSCIHIYAEGAFTDAQLLLDKTRRESTCRSVCCRSPCGRTHKVCYILPILTMSNYCRRDPAKGPADAKWVSARVLLVAVRACSGIFAGARPGGKKVGETHIYDCVLYAYVAEWRPWTRGKSQALVTSEEGCLLAACICVSRATAVHRSSWTRFSLWRAIIYNCCRVYKTCSRTWVGTHAVAVGVCMYVVVLSALYLGHPAGKKSQENPKARAGVLFTRRSSASTCASAAW